MTAAFVRRLDFDRERMLAGLTMGHIDATLRMEARVNDGVPLREAHHAVAADLADGAAASGDEVARLADTYKTTGAASPAETRRVADALLAALP